MNLEARLFSQAGRVRALDGTRKHGMAADRVGDAYGAAKRRRKGRPLRYEPPTAPPRYAISNTVTHMGRLNGAAKTGRPAMNRCLYQ